MPPLKSLLLSLVTATSLIATSSADVVINEFSATSSDRLLRWDDSDQPFVGSGHSWWSGEFDSSVWQTGSLPIGFGINPLSTNLTSELQNVTPSLYVRKSFNVSPSDASSSGILKIQIAANDGYIIWVNGIEYARSNMGAPNAMIYHDQVAYRAGSTSTTLASVTLGTASSILSSGDNVIAVQLNNSNIASSMRLDMSLIIDNPSGTDPTLFPAGTNIDYLVGTVEPGAGLYEPNSPNGPSDWIELHNNGPASVNISGWTLTDDITDLTKWAFSGGTSIGAGEYLVVLADAPLTPIAGATYLHTNFSLSSGGEYLGLFDDSQVAQTQFNPDFPNQYPFQSYGLASGSYMYLGVSTPGAANSTTTYSDKVDAPDFDNKGGFYDSAVTVTLTTETAGAIIRYTTNGTEPTLTNGLDYTASLTLAQISNKKGHVIRARAFLAGLIPSNTKTNTYLINQDARLKGKPSLIFSGDQQRSLYDPFGILAINGGSYSNSNWVPTAATDYNNVINRGQAYERPIHAEFYFGDGSVGFRTDCGIRAAASSYSRPRMVLNSLASSPWPANPEQKSSFNLYFRNEYGNPDVTLPLRGENATVNTFDRFRIRAGKNDIKNPFIIDELVRRISTDMGQGASNGIINTVYVNGELKGFYNMVERLRSSYFASLHGSEPGVTWDVLQFEGNDNIAEGDKVAWNEMIARMNAPVTDANWERVREYADVVNMADYFLLNVYMATWDWPHNNWVAARERSDKGRYRFYVWDAEGGMNNKGNRPVSQEMISAFIATGSGELRDAWRGLMRWNQYKLLFADRINKHMFNGGVIDDQDYANSHLKFRHDQLVGEFSDLLSVMNGESPIQSIASNWANNRRKYLFGPTREDFRNQGLWPTVTPPNFSIFGGNVSEGTDLTAINEIGQLVYTTDGSDPRMPDGTINPNAVVQEGSSLITDLIASGSPWKINKEVADLGTTWKETAYDDSDSVKWITGNSPIGFGGIGSPSIDWNTTGTLHFLQNLAVTAYYRGTFEIEDANAFYAMKIGLRIDDGVIVYINGNEVARENLTDPVTFTKNAVGTSDEVSFDEYDLNMADFTLVTGTNTIAVETHNSSIGSSDMVMDMWLKGERTNPANLPIVIDEAKTISARSYDNGTWSAITNADFTVETEPAVTSNLAIIEMLYNPAAASQSEINAGFTDGDQFEFVRLRNIGTMAIDLHNVRFTDGIVFDFSTSAIRALGAGKEVLIVSDLAAFRQRNGTGLDGKIAGQYSGKLKDGGEHLRLVDAADATLHDFTFDDIAPWPDFTLAKGYSIQIIDFSTDHGVGANWKLSSVLGGNPSGTQTFTQWAASSFTPAEQSNPLVSGPDADPDGDGLSNFAEFALGTPPKTSGAAPIAASTENIGGSDYVTLEFTKAAGTRTATFNLQTSPDLQTWISNGVHVSTTTNGDGSTTTIIFRDTQPIDPNTAQQHYIRLLITE
jgi:hypothetical protein